MKISKEHFEALRKEIQPLDTEQARAKYLAGDFSRAELVRDLDKRYRWDLFWLAGARNVIDGGADYLDVHIDTALRGIVPPLPENCECDVDILDPNCTRVDHINPPEEG